MDIPLMKLRQIGLSALNQTYQLHQKLGKAGEEIVTKKGHGDAALRMDIEAEQTVMDAFRKAHVPIRFVSEEHGITDIGSDPQFLGVLDGLDGTAAYKKARGRSRYCTMLGIFSTSDPRYDDYLFSGVIEHAVNRLYYAIKGQGSFVIVGDKRTPLQCSVRTVLDKGTTIQVDKAFDYNLKSTLIHDLYLSKLAGFSTLSELASGIHYTDLAEGKADLVLEVTRKSNLEIAAAYGLVAESGGVIVSIDGSSLGLKKYLSFGQKSYEPVISAATMQLAQQLINKIQSS